MAVLTSEAELWIPPFFKISEEPELDIAGAITLLLGREAYGAAGRASPPGPIKDEYVQKERRFRDLYDACRRIPSENSVGLSATARRAACTLLDIILKYGTLEPGTSGSYGVSIHSRLGDGEAVTKLRAHKPEGTERMSSEAFVEEMLDLQKSAPRSSGRDIVKFKIFPPAPQLPTLFVTRHFQGRCAPDASYEGGISTQGPYFWGSYRITPEAAHPIPVTVTEGRNEEILCFAEQLGAMVLSKE